MKKRKGDSSEVGKNRIGMIHKRARSFRISCVRFLAASEAKMWGSKRVDSIGLNVGTDWPESFCAIICA
jgi:hypothetical protein